jgi:hypothetical protein
MGNHQSYAAKNVGASTNKGFETNKTDGLDMIFHEEIEEKWRYVEMINSNLGGVSASDVNRRQRSIHKDGHMENAAKYSYAMREIGYK